MNTDPKPLFIPDPSDNGVDSFLERMAKKESGGNYSVLGPVINNGGMYQGDRAVGKYQVMGKNVPSWTKQYLGKSMSAEQFRADKNAQDNLMRARANELYKKYSNWADVASVHFTGQPLSKSKGKKDQLGTTAESYARDVGGKSNLFVDTVKEIPNTIRKVAVEARNLLRPTQTTQEIEEERRMTILPSSIRDIKKKQAMDSGALFVDASDDDVYNDRERYLDVAGGIGSTKRLAGKALDKAPKIASEVKSILSEWLTTNKINPESNVYIVGSRASGKSTPKSDWDIVVEGIRLPGPLTMGGKEGRHLVEIAGGELIKGKPAISIGKVRDVAPRTISNRNKGMSSIETIVAGAGASAASVAMFIPAEYNVDLESAENEQQPASFVLRKPPVVSRSKDLYGGYSTLATGTTVRDIPKKYEGMINKAYASNPELPKGVLEMTLMQESSAGTNRASYNPKIGQYAWLTGFTLIAKQELIRNGIVPDLDTPEGVLKATADYLSLKQTIKDATGKVVSKYTDPVELYLERYSSGKLKGDTVNKLSELYAYYAGI